MIRKKGFTLVELNLAMLFVAMLLLGIALTTIHITKIYQRGSTVKMINQLGREVSGQIQRDIAAARLSDIESKVAGNSGRLCLGTASYVYNIASAAVGSTINDPAGKPIFLARVDDRNGAWCEESGGVYTKDHLQPGDTYTELLVNDVIPLAVHVLDITTYEPDSNSAVSSVKQGLYQLTMQLGTNEAQTTAGGKCLPPTDNTANFENCFIAEFNTVIRAGEVAR